MHTAKALFGATAWVSLALFAAGHANAAVLDIAVAGADGKPLPNAVVYLESAADAAATSALRSAPAHEIAQEGKQFLPRVSVVGVGTQVRFPNRDTVRHHVYSFSPAKTFELKLYIGTPASPVTFDQPGLVVLGCNIHDSMVAWLLVVPTPYHAVSGADGLARIELPAGNYSLRSWHNGLPVQSQPQSQAVQVPSSGTRAIVRLPVT